MRLDLLLIRQNPSLARRKAREVIEKGQVSVDGERVREAGRDVREDAVVGQSASQKRNQATNRTDPGARRVML